MIKETHTKFHNEVPSSILRILQSRGIEEKDFEEFLDGFIDGLNEEDRKLIEYRNADLSYKEIAERLKVSNKRIDNRLRLLKKRFKEEYRRKNGITF